ncbi:MULTISPECIES: phosphoenolpyruvate carboxykinase (GTP) [unclassified Pseudoxanthomonas]|uniref:phosphoenolpyruvate carboxykinase (GTP) n=1 Tax=unclassified Pseudoxanthomonas TaxID=2645906 RepID=UPI0016215868|nr:MULTISPECIES: phosphoenolpyruvate carboxykinase (GTP) [unclassified Pseudoxanthomonas]MBB3277803.1 phosphoenolpyruvate carboxykinase (GTP) [Pseudoxanthomonas sp. OG2]MBV7474475.1 phosphoenolpyruvate carboxykinase (GTP) [Pseudoxanthomonas sp. PXM05]
MNAAVDVFKSQDSQGCRLDALNAWVAEVAALTQPDHIHWCDGSDAENAALIARMQADGTLLPLNRETHPHSWLHRSSPSDVARVEHLTFVCTPERDDAGPNNHWMAPAEAHAKMDALFAGCMRGRTLYVVPYCMGPIDSPLARCGVEITDSPYVVANMRIMTRMGAAALARIEREGSFVKGLHSIGELDPERRFIMHFPEELTIKSYGSGYGGNALLGKKCHALRIASHQARQEGWLAEHMLIVGIENPQGQTHYVAAAFPSACGKTNLAMLIPPEGYRQAGWKVWTVGDDICWMRPGADGRLYAINPEAGFFGVAPGTSDSSNPNALATISHHTIFTNVAVTDEQEPWWEGLDGRTPALDWQGRPYDPANGPAAHPNSRFTVSARQCPSYSPRAEDPQGVPISAIVFGGRRASLVPLVFEARDWTHGVLVGAAMGSETTAAATGAVGVMRRDPMAMKPFCGYNFADYFAHWLSFDQPGAKLPKIFHVNWFRKGDDGKFLWPGFGENLRVLEWMIKRVEGQADAVETPIGHLPRPADLNLEGVALSQEAEAKLFGFDRDGWRSEVESIGAYLEEFGGRMPGALKGEQERIASQLG